MGIRTNKCIYPEGKKNTTKIKAYSYSVNFLGVLGFNADSFLLPIKTLDEFEFAKSLLKIRNIYSSKEQDEKVLNYIIENFSLSKREIREKIEEEDENNENFLRKILRSLERNKKDKSSVLARKIGKHCKSESTENPEKIKSTKFNHIFNLINEANIFDIFEKRPRIVVFLDNAPAHTTDFVKEIADALNIYLLYLPEYSPEFNSVEKVWEIQKKDLKKNTFDSKEELIRESQEIFENKCLGGSLQKNFKEKYLTVIC